MFSLHPAGKCLLVHRCVSIEVGRDTIFFPEKKAKEVALLKTLLAEHVSNIGTILVTPYWPGAYTLLPRSVACQEKEIVRIAAANPELLIIVDDPLDGGYAHSLAHTNPLIYKCVVINFVEIPVDDSETLRVHKPK
jgi:hypothetical protein